MNGKTGFMIRTLLSLLVLAASLSDASAARMGGGRSFGSRPSYSTPYQRSPSSVNPGASRPSNPAQSPAASPAQARNQSIRDSLAQRGGLARFLGGLALGGLLGALFFGGGFEHLNILDLLVFGGVALLLFKLLASRRPAPERVATQAGYYGGQDRQENVYERHTSEPVSSGSGSGGAGFDTDLLSRKTGFNPAASAAASAIPADFDATGFLQGARSAYALMQEAWDKADLAELRALTTDKVFGELQDQIRARGLAENRTELLEVEAELLEVRDIGEERVATVLFDVLMREQAHADPARVQEVWHFTRARNSRQPTWFLDGIQQLEA